MAFAQSPSPFGRPRAVIDLEIRTRIAGVKADERDGKLKAAEDGYRSLLDYPPTKRDPTIRLAYSRLLVREGKHASALETARPLVF